MKKTMGRAARRRVERATKDSGERVPLSAMQHTVLKDAWDRYQVAQGMVAKALGHVGELCKMASGTEDYTLRPTKDGVELYAKLEG